MGPPPPPPPPDPQAATRAARASSAPTAIAGFVDLRNMGGVLFLSLAGSFRMLAQREAVVVAPKATLLATAPVVVGSIESWRAQPPHSPSPLIPPFQHRRNHDAELEQNEHRDQLEQGGHGVGAWQQQRERDECDDRIAPVLP